MLLKKVIETKVQKVPLDAYKIKKKPMMITKLKFMSNQFI
jgi:hypothetical protein